MKKYSQSIIVLFFICCFHLQTAYAQTFTDQYKRYVESVSYSSGDNFSTLAIILLSDGTKWKFITNANDDVSLFRFEKTIQPGNEVLMDTNNETKHYRIQVNFDEQTNYSFLVYIDKETLSMKALFPSFVKEEKILVKEGGWFSAPTYEYYAYLSDNSIWKSSYPFHWTFGDSIIISKSDFIHDVSTRWRLINMDKPLNILKIGNRESIFDFRKHFFQFVSPSVNDDIVKS